jgi:hypothetical protein
VFTGTTTAGNSVVFQRASNVGIGTVTPGSPLTVAGSTNSIAITASSTAPGTADLIAQLTDYGGSGLTGTVWLNYWNGGSLYDGVNSGGGGFSNVVGSNGHPGRGGSVNDASSGAHYALVGDGMLASTIPDPTDPTGENRLVTHAPGAPEVYLMDFGQGRLAKGVAHVDLDARLAGSIFIDDDHPLRVFIQTEDDEDSFGVVVKNKTAQGFDVVERRHGTSNTRFQWQIIGNRADEVAGQAVSVHAGLRFEVAPSPPAAGETTVQPRRAY